MGLSGNPAKRAAQQAAQPKTEIPGPQLQMFAVDFGADLMQTPPPGMNEKVVTTYWGAGNFGANILVPAKAIAKIGNVFLQLAQEAETDLVVPEKPTLVLPGGVA